MENMNIFIHTGGEKNHNYWSGIVSAIKEENLDMVKDVLIETFCDIDIKDEKGFTILMHAAKGNDLKIVEYLIKKRADIYARSNDKGWTPLMFAINYTDNLEIIKYLINEEANVDDCDYNKLTPLMIAVLREDLYIVEYLLTKNININAQHKDGETALMFAVERRNLDAVKLLLKYNADMNIKNNKGETALTIVKKGESTLDHEINWKSKEIRDFLKSVKKEIDTKKNDNGDYYLDFMQAVDNDNLVMLMHLIKELKVDIDIRNTYDMTPLMYATINGRYDMVEYLINEGANVNVKDNENMTALMFASRYNYLNIVEILIKHGADVNAKTNKGMTALMFAAMNGHKDIVKYLLKCKADTNIRNEFGYTVLDYILDYMQ